jgi:hypothetical protein
VAAIRISLGTAALAALIALTGCGASSSSDSSQSRERRDLQAYVKGIEPLRLGVNELLDGADPILSGYREHRLTAAQAQARLNGLERSFASYMRKVAAVQPVPPDMVAAQRAYAHTYAQEDAYLLALVAALPSHDWSALPQTEDQQRTTLVAWRAKLALEASRLGVAIPSDMQRVGRDEIVPSPLGDDS